MPHSCAGRLCRGQTPCHGFMGLWTIISGEV